MKVEKPGAERERMELMARKGQRELMGRKASVGAALGCCWYSQRGEEGKRPQLQE